MLSRTPDDVEVLPANLISDGTLWGTYVQTPDGGLYKLPLAGIRVLSRVKGHTYSLELDHYLVLEMPLDRLDSLKGAHE